MQQVNNNYDRVKLNILKYFTLFMTGALVYMTIEILWRGHTHWTMGIIGGIVLILVGLINEFDRDIPLLVQAPLASIIITSLEYISGYVLNIKLGLNIWDYSHMPLNVDGQVCLPASILWMFVGLIGVLLDDWVRSTFFGESNVKHKLI